MSYLYKKPSKGNYPEIVEIINSAEEPYKKLPILKKVGIDLTITLDDLKKNRMRRKYRVLLRNKKLIGFAAWKKKFGHAWLSEFVIKPDFQGKGYGEILLKFLEKEVAQEFEYLTLEYWPDAFWAEKFYQKHGYRHMPEIFKNKSNYTKVLTKKLRK